MNCKTTLKPGAGNISDSIYAHFINDDSPSLIVLSLDKPEGNRSQFGNLTSKIFSYFLTTTRTGSAHRQAGISVRTFLSSMAASIVYFGLQVLLFTFLRQKFKYIYQGRIVRSMTKKPDTKRYFKNPFKWIYIVIQSPVEKYREKVGLDAYLFLRFLRVLTFFFLTLSLINIPILMPIHYLSSANGSNDSSPWLDRLNMSSIVAKKSNMLVFHLILCIFVVVWFHAILIRELKHVFEVTKQTQLKVPSNIFVENIPESSKGNRMKIISHFDDLFPGSVLSVRFLPQSSKELRKHYEEMLRLTKSLEATIMDIVLEKYFLKVTEKLKKNERTELNRGRQRFGLLMNKLAFYLKTSARRITCVDQIKMEKRKSIFCFLWPRFTFTHTSYASKRYRDLEDTWKRYESVSRIWHEECRTLERCNNTDYVLANKNRNSQVHYDKAFIKISSTNVALAIKDLLISGNDCDWRNVVIMPTSKDIIWYNIKASGSIIRYMRSWLANTLGFLIIIGYILPVALIGLLSQVPYAASLIPLFSELHKRSEFFNDVIAGVTPVITLIFLTEFVPFIFRWFGYLRCRRTGAEMEADIQVWFFAFLFVHVFLVVTVSSGLSIVVEKIVNNPVSIPTLLAHDLPKSSNFFCSFILLRGLAYSGGNLLQLKDLLLEIFYYRISLYPPHKRLARMEGVPFFQWGSIYPLFSVLGCIGIVYSVISPLILPLSSVAFSLVLFSFKYLYEFQYQGKNVSETFGRLYPASLMQLYAGVYCMEFCILGLFVLGNCYRLCVFMVLTFIATMIAHFEISEAYVSKLYKFNFSQHLEATVRGDNSQAPISRDFEIPFADGNYTPQIWIPKDIEAIGEEEKALLQQKYKLDCGIGQCLITETGDILF